MSNAVEETESSDSYYESSTRKPLEHPALGLYPAFIYGYAHKVSSLSVLSLHSFVRKPSINTLTYPIKSQLISAQSAPQEALTEQLHIVSTNVSKNNTASQDR